MAIIHDVMPVFELFQPTTIDDTVALLESLGAKNNHKCVSC